jgi:hypothetical protein
VAGFSLRLAQLPPSVHRANPLRSGSAPHSPGGSSHHSTHQRADDEENRRENCLAQAPPCGAQSTQARTFAEADALAYDEKHLRQHQRIC